MFAPRSHSTVIELAPDEERWYRLPPAAAGMVTVKVFHADVFLAGAPRSGPRAGRPISGRPRLDAGTVFDPGDGGLDPGTGGVHSDSSSATDVQVDLWHSQQQLGNQPHLVLAQSLWHDDLWRLRLTRRMPAGDVSTATRSYRVETTYTSQLPVLQRRIDAGFFHDGFEFNYNAQQYVRLHLNADKLFIDFSEDFRQLNRLDNIVVTLPVPIVGVNDISMTSLRFDVGAGPAPWGGGNAPFFSARAEFPGGGEIDVPAGSNIDLPPFFVTARFYLEKLGGTLRYRPQVESNLLDLLAGVNVPDPSLGDPTHTVNAKAVAKNAIERALFDLQFPPQSGFSRFGGFVLPWLLGDRRELWSLGYAPGAGDQVRGDGVVEAATGDLVLDFVGRRPKPDQAPVLADPTASDVRPGGLGTVVSGGTLTTETAAPSGERLGTLSDLTGSGIRIGILHVLEGGDSEAARNAPALYDVPDEDPDPLADPDIPAPRGGGGALPRPRIGSLSKVDHIVVLMMENRSFDQVLGYLSRELGRPDVDGLNTLGPDPTTNAQHNRHNDRLFFPERADATAWPSFSVPGPCHDTDCVLSQIDQNMGRFVASFAKRVGDDPALLHLVMDYFGPDQLPVYAMLAKEFGICDRWFTSHAGPTWPNRFVLLTGDLNLDPFGNVEEDNPDFTTMLPIQTPTLFDHLNDLSVPWRVFEHGYSFIRLFGRHTFDTTNVVAFDDPVRGFDAAARGGTLPPVTLIEPDYIDLPPGNDDHPPADMADGQRFVNRVVQALMAGPAWERTMLVITYDEHGGFYDHVNPPTDAPPLRGSRRTLGPRVPTFVVSPLVERGRAIHETLRPHQHRRHDPAPLQRTAANAEDQRAARCGDRPEGGIDTRPAPAALGIRVDRAAAAHRRRAGLRAPGAARSYAQPHRHAERR